MHLQQAGRSHAGFKIWLDTIAEKAELPVI